MKGRTYRIQVAADEGTLLGLIQLVREYFTIGVRAC